MNKDLIKLVRKLSANFTKIILKEVLTQYPSLTWGNNGIGNRWAKKLFNYTVVYSSGKYKTYSTNDNELYATPKDAVIETKGRQGIIGIFVHSIKTVRNVSRPISAKIARIITARNCVVCGSTTDIICDHKNDLYNDEAVLNTATQTIDDFQALCNHCNLQKRQVCKAEKQIGKTYSAKSIPQFAWIPFEFPWEKYTYPFGKCDSYWHDPIEFGQRIHYYASYTWPIVCAIKIKFAYN